MSLAGKQVLIIDDRADIRLVCKAVCETLGMVARDTDSVAQGIQMVAEKKPDIIILDLNIPGMSGFDFLDLRQFNPVLNTIPVMVSSSHKDKDSVDRAILLGANDYLLKPVNPSFMSHRLKKYLYSGFSQRLFGERERPFLTVYDEGRKVGAKLVEVSELGMVVLVRAMLSPGESYRVFGESLREILKKNKPFEMTCLSISMNPVHEAYTAYFEFDQADPVFAQNVRSWIKAA